MNTLPKYEWYFSEYTLIYSEWKDQRAFEHVIDRLKEFICVLSRFQDHINIETRDPTNLRAYVVKGVVVPLREFFDSTYDKILQFITIHVFY